MLPLFTYNYSNTATPPKENFQLDGGQQNRARKTIQNKNKNKKEDKYSQRTVSNGGPKICSSMFCVVLCAIHSPQGCHIYYYCS